MFVLNAKLCSIYAFKMHEKIVVPAVLPLKVVPKQSCIKYSTNKYQYQYQYQWSKYQYKYYG